MTEKNGARVAPLLFDVLSLQHQKAAHPYGKGGFLAQLALVAKLVDALSSGGSSARCESSSLSERT
jgi:hypothetical protein